LFYHNATGNSKREGLKKDEIGQSAAERLWRKSGEGSTTRIYHLKARPKMMKSIGEQGSRKIPWNPKCPTPTRISRGWRYSLVIYKSKCSHDGERDDGVH